MEKKNDSKLNWHYIGITAKVLYWSNEKVKFKISEYEGLGESWMLLCKICLFLVQNLLLKKTLNWIMVYYLKYYSKWLL